MENKASDTKVPECAEYCRHEWHRSNVDLDKKVTTETCLNCGQSRMIDGTGLIDYTQK